VCSVFGADWVLAAHEGSCRETWEDILVVFEGMIECWVCF